MKLFRWTLATIVAVGLVFVAGGLLLPSTTHVERSVVIERSPEQVFATLDSFERFNAWSPWAEYDPQARYTFDGPAQGAAEYLTDLTAEELYRLANGLEKDMEDDAWNS